ncbi:MAG: adenylate cyclase [Parasphingorhabdus sp.]|jgi:adenylate cyclase
MSQDDLHHKLTTILYADVAGYSRLTGNDEAGTHRRVMATLDFATDAIASGGGKVLRYAGDAILAEYPSVVSAVRSATVIQQTLYEQSKTDPADQRVEIRVGINLGEVLEDRGEIYGDGVNIAARLEQLCEPGGLCISDRVYEQIEGKVSTPFIDTGSQEFKNIKKPVRTFQWHPDKSRKDISPVIESKKVPSIRIVSFSCLPVDDDNLVLTEELNQQIHLRISKRTGVKVIDGGNSSKGADYELRGKINRLGERYRANLSMAWCSSGETVWADSFSGSNADPFGFIEQITDTVNAAIRVQNNAYDARRLNDKEESSLSPSELLTRAADFFYRINMDDWRHAVVLLDRAIIKIPNDPMALAMRVEGGTTLATVLPIDLHEEDDDQLLHTINKAISLDNHSDYSFSTRSSLFLRRFNQFEEAIRDARHALSISPSYIYALDNLGEALLCMEDLSGAIEHLKNAVSLSSDDPFLADRSRWLAMAYLLSGNDSNAIESIDLSLQLQSGVSVYHHLKGQILAYRSDDTYLDWFKQAEKLSTVYHPLNYQLTLPEKYQTYLQNLGSSNIRKIHLKLV